jgi:hypothetical protein
LVEAAQLKVAPITIASRHRTLTGSSSAAKVRILSAGRITPILPIVYAGDSSGFLVFGLMQRIRG